MVAVLAVAMAEIEARRRTCTLPDCDRPHHGRGYCARHYRRWRKRGDPNIVLPSGRLRTSPATCTLPDCDRPYSSKGYCGRHYQRWRKHGDPYAGAA